MSILARTPIETRGKLDQGARDAFLAAGFGPAHLLEVVAVSAASTVKNYTGNITRPPLAPALRDRVWHAA